MYSRTVLSAGLLSAVLVVASDPAEAFTLRMTDLDTGSTITMVDNQVAPPPPTDLDLAPYELTFDCTGCGWIGTTNWSSIVVSAEVTPAPGLGGVGARQLNLTVDAESIVAANLKVEVTETDLMLSPQPWLGRHQATGNISGSGSYNVTSYWDAGNVAFAPTDMIGDGTISGVTGVSAGSLISFEAGTANPFSMTTVMFLSHGAGFSSSSLNTSQAGLTPVPLPAAGWLLLGALGAMAAARRKKA